MERLCPDRSDSTASEASAPLRLCAPSLRYVRFTLQALVSGSVAVFCMYEIASGDRSPVYYSLLSGIVGTWLPTPAV